MEREKKKIRNQKITMGEIDEKGKKKMLKKGKGKTKLR